MLPAVHDYSGDLQINGNGGTIALQYEVKIMLQAMVEDEHYLTLNELNSRLGRVELGYMEAKDRPSPIGDQKLSGAGHTLNQAGV